MKCLNQRKSPSHFFQSNMSFIEPRVIVNLVFVVVNKTTSFMSDHTHAILTNTFDDRSLEFIIIRSRNNE